jgi:large subunit ribosomal protein L10
MARPDKVADVAELVEEFRASDAVVLTEYRGLTVAQITELRRNLGDGVTYTVVKNTLARRAAKEAGAEALVDEFSGPSAVAFVKGDPVEAAKGLRDFSKAHHALVLRGGLLSGRVMDAAEIARLADLESREVLLSKLAGAMKASAGQAVSLFAAPLAQTARVVDALRAQVEENAPAAATEALSATDSEAEPASAAEAQADPASAAEAQAEDASEGVDRREPAEEAASAGADVSEPAEEAASAGADVSEPAEEAASAGADDSTDN